MKYALGILIAAGALLTESAGAGDPFVIQEKVPVASVWSATGVGFALETVGDQQFVCFYDADRVMTVGQRKIDSADWTFKKLPSTLEWDSHHHSWRSRHRL